MLLAVASLLLTLKTGFVAAAAAAAPAPGAHSGLINEWNDIDSNLAGFLHTLVPRYADWNTTWIDSQRNRCADPLASEQCCPGYCSVDYRNLTGGLFYTCCPVGYYAAAFGKSNTSAKVEIKCCDETVSPCEKGKSTKQAVVPFVNATTDVQVLEQQCSSGASKLYMSSTAILLAMVAVLQLSLLG